MNKIFLYNTLGRKKEIFKPIKNKEVLFYHCGPTVYWTQHIGNLRSMVCADLIVRSFKYLDYKVKHVRNYTDVGHLTGDNEGDADTGEDRMEKAAKKEGINPEKIASKYIEIFERDTKEMNILDPNFKPKATEYIDEMIKMTEVLLEKGYAYSTDLAIYFDVDKFKDYTKLSCQKLEKNIGGKGKGEVQDRNKKNPYDFALWFFRAGKHEKALQYWKSPFSSPLVKNGYGFPGWCIECSAMSRKLLGKTIDIHMGGIEHIPIHHTNEIAQSEAANGVKFSNYWLHNEHLLVNSKKMSKSEGTGFNLEDIKKKGFEPLDLRFFFLQAHYRSKQNFTWKALEAAQKGLKNIKKSLDNIFQEKKDVNKVNIKYKKKFISFITDDFNIPKALSIVSEILKSNLENEIKYNTILDFDRVFDLDLGLLDKKNNPIQSVRDLEIKDLPEEIKKLKKVREKARQEKNWQESDRIRDELIKKGFIVKDTKNGMKIYQK